MPDAAGCGAQTSLDSRLPAHPQRGDPVLLGRYDVANVERPGVFSQVAGYDQSIVLLPAETLKRLAAVTFARGLGQG